MPGFDLNIAKEMVESFAAASGLGCRLLDDQGNILSQAGLTDDECTYLRSLPGQAPVCRDLHAHGLHEAQRFGGRYIYSCAAGFAYCSSPILTEGVFAGGLVAGPVIISDIEDCMDDIILQWDLPAQRVRALYLFLSSIPQVATDRLRHLSNQLFAAAVYISDSSYAFFLNHSGYRQQCDIGEYVQQAKGLQGDVTYPIETEQAMLAAVSQGDSTTASALLNELLGHIFFLSRDATAVQTYVTELVVLLSRAAINGGVAVEQAMEISHRYLQEIKSLTAQEEVASCLNRALTRFADLVFELLGTKHKNVIREAIGYMSAHCARALPLAEVADYVGYSPSHFSKVFKEEMGCGFRAYLNQLRVERSRVLLLSSNLSISEICERCGFEDPSYHCKVFKKLIGVTPDKYRKQSRRIDAQLEYGG
ncbi:hypothetical protein B5G34_12000 [Flavonifractor sp. An82]|uniref:helix-turn-helix domain-containing protein n=1 Tax=Flavonifractor sp. An82 TaxID=1965660 RepID=UPI000B3AF787|nr:helix-turn-helix domain-containing protein [Flavonifractor sp. An82]OUN21073.1 hypothetical protein B5G34_12000 [Flavonifractor sp. An82]